MVAKARWVNRVDSLGRTEWLNSLVVSSPGPTPPDPPTVDALTPQVSPRSISGTAEPGAMVQAIINGVPHITIYADGVGDWAFVFVAAPGNYGLEVRQIVDSVASEYSDQVVFVLIPDEPLPTNRGAGRHGKDEYEHPMPMGEEPARLAVPFRRPAAWPREKA
jgi:hypothetical protein